MRVLTKALSGRTQDPVGARSRTIKVAALLCVVLLALLAFAQATHMHRNSSDADHCALCVVLHSAVPAAAAAAVLFFTQVAVAVPVCKARSITRYWHPQLFNRPPPAAHLAFFGVA